MLTTAQVFPTIPVTDLVKAKAFYQNILGLKQIPDPSTHGYMFGAGGDTKLFIYQKNTWIKDDHVIAAFFVDDIEKTVTDLTASGVTFLQAMEGVVLDTKGIVTGGKEKAAWFVDPDGNVLSLSQLL